MLDLIGKAMNNEEIGFERLDGTRPLPQRERALKEFRSNPKCEVLLASLGAGGVGYVDQTFRLTSSLLTKLPLDLI